MDCFSRRTWLLTLLFYIHIISCLWLAISFSYRVVSHSKCFCGLSNVAYFAYSQQENMGCPGFDDSNLKYGGCVFVLEAVVRRPKNLSTYSETTWYMEYYLHGLGPVLMWIDAFFILGAFRKIISTLWTMLLVFFGYIVWIEFFVTRFNTDPIGSETNGLPYLFLNDMTENARIDFYATTLITAIILFGVSSVIVRAWNSKLGVRSFRSSKTH